MEINKDKAISNIKDEYAAHCTRIVQSLIDHLAYSVADIESWDELTEAEKKIIPKEIFDNFV